MRRPGVTRRQFLRGAAGAGALGLAFRSGVTPVRAQGKNEIVFVGFGGTYQEGQTKALFEPFEKETGIKVIQTTGVDVAKLRAQVQSKNVEWDFISIPDRLRYTAVRDGLLMPLDYKVINAKDVMPALVTEYAVGAVTIPMLLTYSKTAFPGSNAPRTWTDFWDAKKFPGTRSLYDRSHTSLAFALLADGVPLDKLYPLDIDRGFRKLDAIKPHIKVWWKEGSQSQQLIGDGEVDMIGMWNARAQELIDRGAPLEIVWNGAENYMGFWFVPKGTPRARLAWEFIAFAVEPRQQAAFCSRLPYGPSNPRAFDHVAPDVAAKMPTAPAHRASSFSPDAAWLVPNLPRLRERWAQWMAS